METSLADSVVVPQRWGDDTWHALQTRSSVGTNANHGEQTPPSPLQELSAADTNSFYTCLQRDGSHGSRAKSGNLSTPTRKITSDSLGALRGQKSKDEYSFLHQRAQSSCSSQATNQSGRNSRSGSVSDDAESSSTVRPAFSHFNKTAKVAGAAQKQEIRTKCSSPHIGKHKSKCIKGLPSFTTLNGRASSASPSPSGLYARRLPMRLPRPPLALISSPQDNLPLHLHRHGLHAEAEDFAKTPGITIEYILQGWAAHVSKNGPAGLLNATSSFMDDFSEHVHVQMGAAQSVNEALPAQFEIPTHVAQQQVNQAQGALPTHVLAIYGTDNSEKGVLIPCHALMYVLQCVSLPSFASSGSGSATPTSPEVRSLPTLPVCVPRPKEFGTLHRFIYTHDASALLVELLPMRHIARYCANERSVAVLDAMPDLVSLGYPEGPSSLPPLPQPTTLAELLSINESDGSSDGRPRMITTKAVEALSHLPPQTLFSIAYKVHAAWANGVAIGFLETSYWQALDRAWTMVVAALGVKKGRIIDADRHGLDLGVKLPNE